MQQVPTQGIASWVVKWSFVSLGEDCVEEANHMHYKREINYHDYHDYEHYSILSAQNGQFIMCLYNISGQIVCITGVKCANPAILLDQ